VGDFMSDHYYSRRPQSKSKPMTWEFQLLGKTYTFKTDVGVFSKNEVDFGTRLLIENFKEPSINGDFLDLGCGYGPIGIALADKFRNRNMIMVDVNERAITLAEHNLKYNTIKNAEVFYSDGFSNLKNHHFAAIITNPPIRAGKKVIYQMFEDSRLKLLKGGELWLVIQKKQGAPSAKKKLEELFDSVETVARGKGYYVFCAHNS